MFSSPHVSSSSSSPSSPGCYFLYLSNSNSVPTSPSSSCLALRPRAHHRHHLIARNQFTLSQPLPSSFTTFTTFPSPSSLCFCRLCNFRAKVNESDVQVESPSAASSSSSSQVNCIGTGLDAECVVPSVPRSDESSTASDSVDRAVGGDSPSVVLSLVGEIWEWGLLVSPFFFWGTAMVAMKEVFPKAGPFFVSSFRLIPAGLLLIAFAASRGRRFPSGFNAWISITLFAIVDAACFQVSPHLFKHSHFLVCH